MTAQVCDIMGAGRQLLAFVSFNGRMTPINLTDFVAGCGRANIAALPSRRECLSLSLMEAAACGRAIIASDVPGCREIVVHEQTGLLIRVDDAPALAEAMEWLAKEPELRARYALPARALIVENSPQILSARKPLRFIGGSSAPQFDGYLSRRRCNGLRRKRVALAQNRTAQYPDAKHIKPAVVEIEQMRVHG
jgi:hypothetical protein